MRAMRLLSGLSYGVVRPVLRDSTAIGTLIVVYVTKALTGGLRVEEEDEIKGLDTAFHGERAFEIQ